MFVSRSLMSLSLCLFLMGCGGGNVADAPPEAETDLGSPDTLGASEELADPMVDPGDDPTSTAAGDETPEGDSALTITPDNTQIQFIGTHNADNPDPRTCEFTEFAGEATLGPNGRLSAISVVIQTDSISTFNNDLTNHLKNEDFLDVRTHDTITFETTSIDVGDEEMTLNGNLTLMGTTNEVSFPARVAVTDGRLSLTGSLTINRSEYGMDKLLDRVNDEVEINVTVGEGG
jgi:polyisoprenoid-binding protein YceI